MCVHTTYNIETKIQHTSCYDPGVCVCVKVCVGNISLSMGVFVWKMRPKKRCLFALFRPTQNFGNIGCFLLFFFFFFDTQFCIFEHNCENIFFKIYCDCPKNLLCTEGNISSDWAIFNPCTEPLSRRWSLAASQLGLAASRLMVLSVGFHGLRELGKFYAASQLVFVASVVRGISLSEETWQVLLQYRHGIRV